MNKCPHCHSGPMSLRRSRLTAKPIGGFSLAGAQMKVSATMEHVLSCSACGWAAVGDVEGLTADAGGAVTGGHFLPRQVTPTPADPSPQEPAAGEPVPEGGPFWAACFDQAGCVEKHVHERDPMGVLRHELPPEHPANRRAAQW